MNSIIIHGASSFIGKNFIKFLLSKEIDVHIIARATSDIQFCEDSSLVKIYRYNESITEINPENILTENPVFIELSWHGVFGSERNIPEQISVNIPLLISSISFAKSINAIHWIGFGSQAEYGDLNKEISENDICKPTTLYGKSKLLCSEISQELCKAYGIEHSWLRLFSVYGPDDNHDWLIQYLIKEMLADNEINVTKAEQYWDYLFVDDISEMLFLLKEKSGISIANLGSGTCVQIKDIINEIKKISQSNSKINFGAIPYRPDQVMFMQADITKLSTHLDWIPKISIEEGLQRTVEFLASQQNQNSNG